MASTISIPTAPALPAIRHICLASGSMATLPLTCQQRQSKGGLDTASSGRPAPPAGAHRGGGGTLSGSCSKFRRHGQEGHLVVGLPQAAGQGAHEGPEEVVGQIAVDEQEV